MREMCLIAVPLKEGGSPSGSSASNRSVWTSPGGRGRLEMASAGPVVQIQTLPSRPLTRSDGAMVSGTTAHEEPSWSHVPGT